MRIKTVSFKSNISIGNYQHVHIEATADVGAKETAENVLIGLKHFVAIELIKAKEGITVKETITRKKKFVDELEEIDSDFYFNRD